MILVTGASGFIGRTLIGQLASAGHPVRALHRRPVKDADYPPLIQWLRTDLLDITSLDQAFYGVDRVFHCAGLVSFQRRDAEAMIKINVEGTSNVVNLSLAHGISKLVHVSSVAALGRPRRATPINESLRWEETVNNSRYGLSKYLGEMEVWRAIGEGLNAVIVNPSIVLGPTEPGDVSHQIVRTVFGEFPWYTEGATGFVDVQDLCRAMIMLMESDQSSRRFIVSGENVSYRELFSALAVRLGKKAPYRKASAAMTELVWRIEKLRSLFTGHRPLITKETARTARLQVQYDNHSILEALPQFRFTSMENTLKTVSADFLKRNTLSPAGR
jgi:dihydroflavonol-4-reductase